MVYLILYEINEVVYDYTDLISAIKGIGSFQHPMKSLWFVYSSDMTAAEITSYLKRFLKSRYDALYVMEVNKSSDKQGWLPNQFWAWLNRNEI